MKFIVCCVIQRKCRSGLGVPDGVRIPVGKAEVGIDAVDMLLCGRSKEKSSDKAVEGKRWSIVFATTVDRKEKNVMSAARGSKTAIGFPEESRNPIPCRLPTTKKAWRTDSTIRSASRSTDPIGMAKYAATVAVKSLIVIEGEEERERMRRKKKSLLCGKARRWCPVERSSEWLVRFWPLCPEISRKKTPSWQR